MPSCTGSSNEEETVEVLPSETAVMTSTMTSTATQTIEVEPTFTPTNTESPSTSTVEVDLGSLADEVEGVEVGVLYYFSDWGGVLERPISAEYTNTIDSTYPYSSTFDGTLSPHHGVEFLNSTGTPVLAAQDGEIVYAGTDDQTVVGPYTGFYGNVVVIQHPGVFEGRDLFTVYGHLSSINVQAGDQVSVGDQIGEVGMTGIATGEHLHFEVRLDENDYNCTTDPVLWFTPISGTGTDEEAGLLAGAFIKTNGEPISEYDFTLVQVNEEGGILYLYYPTTYYTDEMNSHPLLGENYVVPDLPAGDYLLSYIDGSVYEVYFTVEPGELVFLYVQFQ